MFFNAYTHLYHNKERKREIELVLGYCVQTKIGMRKCAQEFVREIKCVRLCAAGNVTRLGDLLDFGQLFKAFGNN